MLRQLYSFLISLAEILLPIVGIFNPKIGLFVKGRKNVFHNLKDAFGKNDKIIWFHAASLGEYEQGVPVMQQVKKRFPEYKILLTFFSPSGYEVKKENPLADFTTYLPLDTKRNARKFVELVRPVMAVFIKYEIWPNYVHILKQQGSKVILISGSFRKNQLYFRSYGRFLRDTLKCFDFCFVQNENSKRLLENSGVKNVKRSGDTRFDRVSHQIEQNNTLDFIENFKKENICVVCGSTWPEDEAILLNFINSVPVEIKFIIVPHSLNLKHINNLKGKIAKKSVLFSEKDGKNLAEYQVFIIDHVGFLNKIYSYADIAYVGGGMGVFGLHNILEPATFGVPIIIGKNYAKFPEAKELRKVAGLFSVRNALELEQIMDKLISDKSFRRKTGMIAGHFVQQNVGATEIIMNYLEKEL
ncbi:MAG TPA: glycosyltransferase N-terminal domain-containing protein [Flavobacteriaceae bacterium]|nr:glycosyltransferase N-terminal domain-containing protein [Flavobacteriaceae bacterium]